MTHMHVNLNETRRYNYSLTNPCGATAQVQATPEMSNNVDNLRPMELLLSALASCSAIDLRMILEKQRQALDAIQVSVDGERDDNQIPACFTRITLHYTLIGDVNKDKAIKAIELALYKYCSVQKHLANLVTIDYQVTILPQGNAVSGSQ